MSTELKQEDVTDAQILSLDCVSIDSDEHGTSFWVDRSTVIQFARAILALRPERKGEPVEGAQEIHDRLMRIAEGVEMYGAPSQRQRASQLQEIARSILALRPERVPMTDDECGEAYIKQINPYERHRSTFMRGVWAAEAHHGITAQAKKETP